MHKPVLLQPTIEKLDIQRSDVVVDATLGLGGHARAMAEKLGPEGVLIGFDADADLLAKAEHNLQDLPCQKIFINENFRYLRSALGKHGINSVDKILFDLGLNSEHFDLSGRGFTFQKDEPLLMTLNARPTPETLTAKEIVNNWAEESIADIIYGYGEEPLARRIAKKIIEARQEGEIETTFELVEIIRLAMPQRRIHGKTHFATKTFQALRIAVNDEIGALKEGLTDSWQVQSCGGRLAAISFHSLEARTVKEFFKAKVREGEGELITPKAIKTDFAERSTNPRSRSAQLRVIKKIK